ncbi:MAG: ribose-phosphate pyrophosphokinase [Bacteroidia bacterium]|nr:ribose-phosphate pyrophosphokinase [Bacteroidia bacterium]
MSDKAKIFAGTATKALAEKIATKYGKSLGSCVVDKFSDGEFACYFDESVRGSDVFIIQSTIPPSDNLMEMLLLADAAKRASASQIVAVIPYFGFSRQDRKDKSRVSIGAKLVADLLGTAGFTRVMTMDLHADQIQGFFNFPVDHLFASTIFLPYLYELNLPNLQVASPDIGGTRRAKSYAKYLKTDMIICHKTRSKANEIESMTIIGDVKGRDVILVDDICDTAGTLSKAADMIMNAGASSVRAVCTHAILSGKAYENIEKSSLSELIVTDSIPLKQESPKIKVLSCADMFADVINKLLRHESISEHFII